MNKTTKRLVGRAVGTKSFTTVGVQRSFRGLRTGDQRELYTGLALLALAFFDRSSPKKELLYRGTLKPGSAVIVHHRKVGGPKISVKK